MENLTIKIAAKPKTITPLSQAEIDAINENEFARYLEYSRIYAKSHKFDFGDILHETFHMETLKTDFDNGKPFQNAVNEIGKKNAIIPMHFWSIYKS